MGELMVTSETGMFHSACRFTIHGTAHWRGFQPARHRMPISAGKVERVDRSSYINHYIKIDVADSVLRRAMNTTTTTYASKNYVLGVVDCVSFSADVARNCRLRVPKVNSTPYGFIEVLSWWNTYTDFK